MRRRGQERRVHLPWPMPLRCSPAPSSPSVAFMPCAGQRSDGSRNTQGWGSGLSLSHSSCGPCPLLRVTLKTWQQGTQRWGQLAVKEAPSWQGSRPPQQTAKIAQGHCPQHPPGRRPKAGSKDLWGRHMTTRPEEGREQRRSISPANAWMEGFHSGTLCILEATESKGEMEGCLEGRKESWGQPKCHGAVRGLR